MTKLPLLILSILLPLSAISQNLITNPGFEEYTKLPKNSSEWDKLIGWTKPDFRKEPYNTPDFYHLKGNGNGKLPTPKFCPKCNILPNEGEAVAGLIAVSVHNLHEYITVKLAERIVRGDTVRISFYYTNGGGTTIGSQMAQLGTYFSMSIPTPDNGQLIAVKPQTEMAKSVYSKEWVLYQEEFIAGATYEYMTIGCFRNFNSADFRMGRDGMFGDWAYYFLDGMKITANETLIETPIVSSSNEHTVKIKFNFIADDMRQGLKIKGSISLAGENFNFTDSVYYLPMNYQGDIEISASFTGYYPAYEKVNSNTLNKNTSNTISLKPLNKGTTIVLQNIFFNSGSSVLLPASFKELDNLAELLASNPKLEILISGHTDNLGNADANLKLSEERAINVMKYLRGNGISAKRLSAKGFGIAKPITDNSTPEGRAKNRRVEFSIE